LVGVEGVDAIKVTDSSLHSILKFVGLGTMKNSSMGFYGRRRCGPRQPAIDVAANWTGMRRHGVVFVFRDNQNWIDGVVVKIPYHFQDYLPVQVYSAQATEQFRPTQGVRVLATHFQAFP